MCGECFHRARARRPNASPQHGLRHESVSPKRSNMQTSRSKNLIVGLVGGISIATFAAVLMGQGASQPVRSEPQYFVTGEADEAHLWVREGASLRCVGHGECSAHAHEDDHGHDHEESDGHDHGKEAPSHK